VKTNHPWNEDRWEDEEALLDQYAERFNLPRERPQRRPRPPKNLRQRFQEHREAVESLAHGAGLENIWETTYTPALFEGGWLKDSLRYFYEQELITDIVAQVKGGKEASVYRCAAHPTLGIDWLAAKVYRPRKLRNMRNDAVYREGRQILTEENGKPAKPRDDRILRAIGKKTAFGAQVQHTSWMMYEFTSLQALHRAGAAVPKPYSVAENAILMAYLGDEQRAAPTLQEAALAPDEVEPLWQATLHNLELLLQHNLVHGDLSAYNILYWDGSITLIDFPQVVDTQSNRSARRIWQRDVQRICDYFAGYGVACHARRIADDLWDRYAARDPMDEAADLSALLWREEDGADGIDDLEGGAGRES
jgi:RIO kinase 1